MMGISADTYRSAAAEHLTVAAELYEASHYLLAHYVAGLAVECILRAYQVRLKAEFDAKHDLRKLAKAAKFATIFPPQRAGEYAAAMTAVYRRWNNDFRYRSAASLRRHLVALKLHEGIKGDFVKESARRIVSASAALVKLGVQKWNP